MRTERLGWLLCVALASLLAPTAMATVSLDPGSVDPMATAEPLLERLAQATADAATPGSEAAEPEGTGGPQAASEAGEQHVARTTVLVGEAQTRAGATAALVVAQAEAVGAEAADVVGDRVLTPLERTREDLEGQVQRIVFPVAPDEEAPEAAPAAPQASTWLAQDLSGGFLLAAGAAATAGAIVVLWLAGSSSTLGGAAAAGAKVGDDLRRLLPYTSPLFSRFEKETVLGHPKREQLYVLVMQTPGITLQDLCERTNLSRTAVTHHLRLLEQHHLLVSKRMGRSRHYYENGGRYGRDQKDAYAVLRNERSREVAQFIQSHPGTIQKDLCQHLGIQASVAHWHVRRLQEAQLVEPVRRGRTVSYYPSTPVPAVPEISA